ncbi:hypothetical protein PaeCFBP13512_16775 [Paenibacillus sp. CFBP13512]|uniref:hypothetical protein n=1 Tax=Paenibacillus sp. CFBP13512 TaxID=2184007 RepID=UPI0010BFCAC3|nr:hypothetical protein [Paenibacillus sp. CFBP13512]TKJ88884.1 hypothetical protein PaeCFBP13512_16775 [Paenibacillus sp. CFBP13512]
MKFSKLIFLLLILLFCISACSPQGSIHQLSNANNKSVTDKKVVNQEMKDHQPSIPLSFETVLVGKNPTSNFLIDAEHNYFQLKIINKSKVLITFNLVNNENGKEVFTDQVKPNKVFTWNSNTAYLKGLDSGKYTIQYRSNGSNMNGIAYGQLSSTPEGLH